MKKAYLSVAALLSAFALAACTQNEADSSSQGGGSSFSSQSQTSSESSSSSSIESSSQTSTSSSSESSESSSSSEEDVITYSLSVSTPSKTTFDVGETFSFNAIDVKLMTFTNGVKSDETILERNQYTVKVGEQIVENDFLFSQAGEFTFVIASVAHPDASNNNLKLTAVNLYTLANKSSDKVVLANLPEKAHAGDNVSFSLRLLPGFYFEGTLLIADANGNAVTYEENGFDYTFTMPDSNITITVTTDLNDFTITRDTDVIDAIKTEDDEQTDVFSAKPGTQLKFATLDNIDWTYDKVYIDGKEVAKLSDNYYHFTMPTHPVKITTNKAHRNYTLSSNATDLKLTTTNMYIDTEAKTPVTEAYKGQVVYLKFTYSVALVKYTVSVKDAKGNTLAVTEVEGESNLYSFTMVSSNITIKITEEDYSTYYGWYVTNKAWSAKEVWSTDSLKTYTKSNFTYNFSFYSNGKGLNGTTKIDWGTTDAKDATSGHLTGTKEFYYTPNMLLTKYYNSASAKWDDAYLATWNPDVTIHVFLFDSTSRLFWIQDDDGTITEKLLINDENVYSSFNIYTDEDHKTLAKGSDITMDSTFYVSVSEDNHFKVSKHTIIKTYTLGYVASDEADKDKFTLKYKNEKGEEIISAENGEKIYIDLALTAAGTGLAFEEPVVKYGTSSVSLTADGDSGTSYYFTMPKGNVTATVELYDPNKYSGYDVVGSYYGWQPSSYRSTLEDASSYYKRSYDFTAAGKFTESYVSGSYTYNNQHKVSDVSSEKGRGTFTSTYSSSAYNTYTYKWYYGGDTIAGISSTATTMSTMYVAYKLPDGKTSSDLSTKTHWNGNYSPTSFAVEWLIDGEVKSGIFAYNNQFYCGVTFDVTDGTEIGATATYNVIQDGETIFTVTKGTVTAASSNAE